MEEDNEDEPGALEDSYKASFQEVDIEWWDFGSFSEAFFCHYLV